MTELVQLDRRHEDLSKRNVRVLVVSVEGLDLAKKTQADFPHLSVASDESLGITSAAGLIHKNAGPEGQDIDLPTTILVDKTGVVRWVYRSPSVIERLSPDELLGLIDQHLR